MDPVVRIRGPPLEGWMLDRSRKMAKKASREKVVPGHSYFCIVKLCKMQVWSRSPHNPRHCTGTHGHEAGAAAVSLMARRWLSASRRLLAPFTSTRSREQRALTASADPASIVAAAGKA